jgi:hypothetical protein
MSAEPVGQCGQPHACGAHYDCKSAGATLCCLCHPPYRYVNIGYDLEFSGSRLDHHFVVSWAMIAEDAVTHQVLSRKKVSFHRPDNRMWDQRCVDEFWKRPAKEGESEEQKRIREALAAEYHSVQNRDAWRKTDTAGTTEMVEWIDSLVRVHAGNDSHNITFVCDTCGPDNMWINYYLAFYARHEPLHTFFGYFKDCVCTSCYALGAAGGSTAEVCKVVKERGYFSEDRAVRKALLIPDSEKPTAPHDHDPLNDATNMLQEHAIHRKYALSSVVHWQLTREESEEQKS